MIPNHILNDLGPDQRVAILAKGGELYFLVHGAGEGPEVVQACADREGSEVLATHMHDKRAILEFVADRERDLGGEG